MKSQTIIRIDKFEAYAKASNQNGLALFSDKRDYDMRINLFPCHLNSRDLLIMVQRRLGSAAMY